MGRYNGAAEVVAEVEWGRLGAISGRLLEELEARPWKNNEH